LAVTGKAGHGDRHPDCNGCWGRGRCCQAPNSSRSAATLVVVRIFFFFVKGAWGEAAAPHTFGELESRDVTAAIQYLHHKLPNEAVGVIGVSLGADCVVLVRNGRRARWCRAMYPTIQQAVAVQGATSTWGGGAPCWPFADGAGAGRSSFPATGAAHRPDGADRGSCQIVNGTQDSYTYIEDARLFAAASNPKGGGGGKLWRWRAMGPLTCSLCFEGRTNSASGFPGPLNAQRLTDAAPEGYSAGIRNAHRDRKPNQKHGKRDGPRTVRRPVKGPRRGIARASFVLSKGRRRAAKASSASIPGVRCYRCEDITAIPWQRAPTNPRSNSCVASWQHASRRPLVTFLRADQGPSLAEGT